MPISIDLLRPDGEGGILDKVHESQCLRHPETASAELLSLLLNLQTQDLARRTEAKDLAQQRNSLKVLQRSLAPNSTADIDKDEAKKQIKQLKESIQVQHDKLQADGVTIHDNLLRVGNHVDKELNCGDGSDVSLPKADLNDTTVVVDPVFCIGGYEKVQLEGSSSFTVLSGHVAELARVVTTYAISSFKGDNFPVVSLPESVSLSTDAVYSLLGCHQPCRVRSKDQQQCPSFLAASLLHREKIYWDRELPRGQVCLTTNQGGLTTFNHTKRKWFQEVPSEQVGLLGMTGCTLGESRKLQVDFVDQIVDFYTSLLVSTSGYTLQHSRHSPMVSKRTIVPSQLEPYEVSRIVIEGYLHGDYVCLGTVSNSTDFVARGVKTRCGGPHVDYVHSVHATCCTVNETLEWVVQNNVLVDDSSGEFGVGIPSNLATLMGYGSTLFLPFQRRLYMGKAGRKPVVKELTPTSPTVIGEIVTVNSDDVRRTKAPFALDRLPNRDEVSAERYMSPFDFLPLK